MIYKIHREIHRLMKWGKIERVGRPLQVQFSIPQFQNRPISADPPFCPRGVSAQKGGLFLPSHVRRSTQPSGAERRKSWVEIWWRHRCVIWVEFRGRFARWERRSRESAKAHDNARGLLGNFSRELIGREKTKIGVGDESRAHWSKSSESKSNWPTRMGHVMTSISYKTSHQPYFFTLFTEKTDLGAILTAWGSRDRGDSWCSDFARSAGDFYQ